MAQPMDILLGLRSLPAREQAHYHIAETNEGGLSLSGGQLSAINNIITGNIAKDEWVSDSPKPDTSSTYTGHKPDNMYPQTKEWVVLG